MAPTASGGVGYPFSGGEVLKTFPHIADQVRWVYYGTEGYNAANIPVYGSESRDGGAHVTGEQGVMPAFGTQLSGADIVAVVCHERYTLGGADPLSDEYEDEYTAWCAPDSPIFAALESGDLDLTTGEMPRGAERQRRPDRRRRRRPGTGAGARRLNALLRSVRADWIS